jgi:hypothetical protein
MTLQTQSTNMTTQTQFNMIAPSTYTLEMYSSIAFNGFEFTVPPETMDIITKLATQVGSPTYIKTPTFHVRTNTSSNTGGSNFGQTGAHKKRGKTQDVSDSDWESIRTFHATKIETKSGIDGVFDKLRVQLNKISDKNYEEMKGNIIGLLDALVEDGASPEDMSKIGNSLFDIAANNRFYSKLYADLYAELIQKYAIMGQVFQENYRTFLQQFENVECGDPDKDYDEFCRINKVNECRRALSLFFVNLTKNGILTKMQLVSTLHTLFMQMFKQVQVAGMQNEVNELAEIIGIIYSKQLLAECSKEEGNVVQTQMRVEGLTIEEAIKTIATSKPKVYPSLSSKTKFKFMDILDNNA